MAKVYWAFLKETHGAAYEDSFDSYSEILEYTARLKDFHRLKMRRLPVAHARNAACQAFFYKTERQDPNDTLVMLDADHVMQKDIVQRLAAHDKGVVGALATSRGEVPFLCFFGKNEKGQMDAMSEWEDGELAEGIVVGSGAIAIKRWVLKELEADSAPSWFRYQYDGYEFEATEEMYFGYMCARHGIPHYCDTSLWIPHCTVNFTTPQEWRDYHRDHPNAVGTYQNGRVVPNETSVPMAQDADPSRNIVAALVRKI